MKKYRVETDLLQNLESGEIIFEMNNGSYRAKTKWDQKISPDVIERNPEWFQPVEEEVEEGDWVIFGDEEELLKLIKKHKGVHHDNYEVYDLIGRTVEINADHIKRKATKDEIETALIAEAKRRGYTYTNFECLIANSISFEHGGYEYDKSVDVLYLSNNACYLRGQWASIVDEPIQINGYEAEFKDGYVQFGCAKIDNQFFLQTVSESKKERTMWRETGRGNKAITAVRVGEGLFTLEDIKKIAKRIES